MSSTSSHCLPIYYIRCVILYHNLEERPDHHLQLSKLPEINERFLPAIPSNAIVIRDKVVAPVVSNTHLHVHKCLLLEPAKCPYGGKGLHREKDEGFINNFGDWEWYWSGDIEESEKNFNKLMHQLSWTREENELTRSTSASDLQQHQKSMMEKQPRRLSVPDIEKSLNSWFQCSMCRILQPPESQGYSRVCTGDCDADDDDISSYKERVLCKTCSDSIYKCHRCGNNSIDDAGWCTTFMCDTELY
jgi:hypothetical protein